MKPGGRFLPGFLFLFLLFFPSAAAAGPNAASRSIDRATQLGLSEEPYWHTLLHYRPTLRGLHSLIDDPRFFLAETGASRPDDELQATLSGFFEPLSDDPDNHPRCRFPARYRWLDEQLDLDSNLPPLGCPKFEKTRSEIDPRSADLIFPGSNFNNPASMFGHTLISINGPHQSKLLAHALNYSAFTEEKNGIAYAIKGVFGFYKGYYSVLPYYAKLKQYNDLERRDIWEYELNLTRAEMERMFLHIWELEDISSDYYFFDENCAYQLLFLFDAARPSLQLVDKSRPWVIPVDTVRMLAEADVVTAANYRPSKATRIAWIVRHMSQAEKKLALGLLEQEQTAETVAGETMDERAKVRVFDLAIETLEFQYLKRDVERPEYRRRYLSLLKQRSHLDPDVPAVPEIPVPTRPDRGHGSNRLALVGGEVDDESYAELRLRPAYHDLLDADDGYLAGSQIVFGDTVARYYPDPDKVRLHRLDLVSIVSLSPRHRFYRPVSWKVNAGFRRKFFPDGRERMLFGVNPGGGFTYGDDRSMLYVLVETDLQASRHYRDKYMLGFGGSAGLLKAVGRRLKLKCDVRQIGFVFGDRSFRELTADAGLNWKLGANASLAIEASRSRIHDRYRTDVRGGLNLYW